MKKALLLIITSALIGSAILSGCNVKINVNNTPTKPTETTECATEGTTTPTKTVTIENTYETIATTQPPEFEKEGLSILYAEGYTENDLRKEYTFDNNDLNCAENRYYVIDRMCNSVDHFTTLQASYISTVNNKSTWVSYAIDRRTNKAKEILFNISDSEKKYFPMRYYYVDGDYHVKLISNEKIKENYTFDFDSQSNTLERISNLINKPLAKEFEEDITATLNSSALPKTDFIDYIHYIDVLKRAGYIESHGMRMPLIIRRSDNNIGLVTAIDHYLPQNIAIDALCNNSDWKIKDIKKEGNYEIIYISGKYHDETFDYDRTFELSIEKNTGIILSNLEYNTSGKLVEVWKTEQLIIDADIDENIFDKIDPNDIVDTSQ